MERKDILKLSLEEIISHKKDILDTLCKGTDLRYLTSVLFDAYASISENKPFHNHLKDYLSKVFITRILDTLHLKDEAVMAAPAKILEALIPTDNSYGGLDREFTILINEIVARGDVKEIKQTIREFNDLSGKTLEEKINYLFEKATSKETKTEIALSLLSREITRCESRSEMNKGRDGLVLKFKLQPSVIEKLTPELTAKILGDRFEPLEAPLRIKTLADFKLAVVILEKVKLAGPERSIYNPRIANLVLEVINSPFFLEKTDIAYRAKKDIIALDDSKESPMEFDFEKYSKDIEIFKDCTRFDRETNSWEIDRIKVCDKFLEKHFPNVSFALKNFEEMGIELTPESKRSYLEILGDKYDIDIIKEYDEYIKTVDDLVESIVTSGDLKVADAILERTDSPELREKLQARRSEMKDVLEVLEEVLTGKVKNFEISGDKLSVSGLELDGKFVYDKICQVTDKYFIDCDVETLILDGIYGTRPDLSFALKEHLAGQLGDKKPETHPEPVPFAKRATQLISLSFLETQLDLHTVSKEIEDIVNRINDLRSNHGNEPYSPSDIIELKDKNDVIRDKYYEICVRIAKEIEKLGDKKIAEFILENTPCEELKWEIEARMDKIEGKDRPEIDSGDIE